MKPKTLKEALKDVLTPEELAVLKRAYDIVGDIAIIEIPDELVAKEDEIAQVVLDLHKNVNVVCKKAGIHDGEYRTQPLAVLAGEDRKETLYKENGCQFFLNPEEVYFSARSATERKRVAGLVQKGEDVLVMFSGIAPFPIVIAKNAEPGSVIGVEKNPTAHDFAMRNVAKNKVDVELHCGDAGEIVPSLGRTFNRVVMPLPKSAGDFLDVAIGALKPGGWIHFYDFQNDTEFDLAVQTMQDAADAANRKLISSEVVVCGQYSPHVNRICVDTQIE